MGRVAGVVLLLCVVVCGVRAQEDDDDVACAFANGFSSNMVLQSDVEVPVFGQAPPGSNVTVTYHPPSGGSVVTLHETSSTLGQWSVALPVQPPSVRAGALAVRCVTAHQPVVAHTLTNVVVGMVLACLGQSNMEFQLYRAAGGDAEARAAKALGGHVRGVTMVRSPHGKELPVMAWLASDSLHPAFPAAFSATCWLTGRLVFQALGGAVPVGLISINAGSTTLQQWASPEVLQACPPPGPPPAVGSRKQPTPSGLWQRLIQPLLRMAVGGWLWWQGESNVARRRGCELGVAAGGAGQPDAQLCGDHYACLFRAFVGDVQATWAGQYLPRPRPFVFVQLEAYTQYGPPPGVGIALLRAAQHTAVRGVNTAMVTAVDVADPSGNPDIHPRPRDRVAHRMAMAVLAVAYGVEEAPVSAPAATVARVQPDGSVRLLFDQPVALAPMGQPPCPVTPRDHCAGLVLVSPSGGRVVFGANNATVGNSSVVVRPPAGFALDGSVVEYLWGNWPLPFVVRNHASALDTGTQRGGYRRDAHGGEAWQRLLALLPAGTAAYDPLALPAVPFRLKVRS